MNTVLSFWFDDLTPKDWFAKSDTLDRRIRERFQSLHARVAAGETWSWRDSPQGRLAEVLVLDQFSRNMFRGTPEAFSTDTLALALAQEAIRIEADKALNPQERTFLYMPYMHSESRLIHEVAVELFKDSQSFDYELRHKAIIDRFGRYPHRNSILNRESTEEERSWMRENSGF